MVTSHALDSQPLVAQEGLRQYSRYWNVSVVLSIASFNNSKYLVVLHGHVSTINLYRETVYNMGKAFVALTTT